MTERILSGTAASPGVAIGSAHVLDAPATGAERILDREERRLEVVRAVEALETAAEQIRRLASDLAARGNEAEAEIVETGALMAADPGLAAAVRSAILEDGADAVTALLGAAELYAQTLAAIDDPVLALRADDVRSLGRRAARLAGGVAGVGPATQSGESVLVARDLGPADVAELGAGVCAMALASGGAMAHAAIVARSLGIPMVVALGEELLDVAQGAPMVVDAGAGSVALEPGPERRRSAQLAAGMQQRARERSAAARELPSETLDGHSVRVLTNVASAAEVGAGLGAGADGVGLLRTELQFLDARAWPVEEQHRRQLAPVLAPLGGMTATVRLLDFGGDKTPPFLRGTEERGIGLLLSHPDALRAQLAAIVAAGRDTDLRILLPMVEAPDEVDVVRALLAEIDGGAGIAVGAMIESGRAVERAADIAARADFLSIGTNDLTHSVLGTDRYSPGEAVTHHPDVLCAIALTVAAAAGAGLIVEVCGEAASDRIAMPALVGLGVQELSVGAARVGTVRAWVRALDYDDVGSRAARTLELRTASEVAEELRPVAELLAEVDDAAGEGLNGRSGVVALGGQP
jgi:phosphoenolpyruvate-protein kinase (PTS system EI component)